jgi:hypothetical protein
LAFKRPRNPVDAFIIYFTERQKVHDRLYAIDELDICSEFILTLEKFAINAKDRTRYLFFSLQPGSF